MVGQRRVFAVLGFMAVMAVAHLIAIPEAIKWVRVREFWHGQDESAEMLATASLLRNAWPNLYGTLYLITRDRLSWKVITPPEHLESTARYTNAHEEVTDAIDVRVQPQLAGNETVFFLFTHGDSDFWGDSYRDHQGYDPADLEKAEAMAAAHPNIFFLSYNPGLVDFERGYIGPNVIPIPDFYPFPPSAERVRCAARKPQLIWRGSTTGYPWAEYDKADRYRAVAALATHNYSDAKFVKIVQDVDEKLITAGMRAASPLSKGDMAKYRAQLDVDGNANAWGLREKLAAGSAVVKVESTRLPVVQWYYPYLEHGKHVLLTDVGGLTDAVERALDPTLCDALGAEASAFYAQLLRAHQYPRQDTSGLSLHSILANFRSYRTKRDWRIKRPRG